MVYFIQNAITKSIKIGKADNVKDRLNGLQTGSDAFLLVLGIIKDAGIEEERNLHVLFAKHRIRENGEWFRPEQEILDYIEDYTEDYGDSSKSRKPRKASKPSIKKTGVEVYFLENFINQLIAIPQIRIEKKNSMYGFCYQAIGEIPDSLINSFDEVYDYKNGYFAIKSYIRRSLKEDRKKIYLCDLRLSSEIKKRSELFQALIPLYAKLDSLIMSE